MQEQFSEPTGIFLVNDVASREGGPYKIPCSRAYMFSELLPENPPIKEKLSPEVLEQVSFPLLDSFICSGKRAATGAAISRCIQYLEIIGKALDSGRGKKVA